MRRSTFSRVSVVTLALGLLVACGNAEPEPEPTATSTSTDATPEVTGAFGEAPTIELPDGTYGGDLVSEVLEEGDGQPLADGELLVANYQGVLWAGPPSATASSETTTSATASSEGSDDGPLFDTFASGQPEAFPFSPDQVLPGMYEGLGGVAMGSRVLLVMPAEAGFGSEGRDDLGVGPNDTLVFVFDLVQSFAADAEVAGTTALDPALPQVADGENGPTVTVPKTAPPTELVTEVLVAGKGDVVETGQLLVVQYRGLLWKDGSEFDASWTNGAPTAFPIGVGGVIPGWDKGLVGQTIGSRVLLVIPPADGYGEAGKPPTIAGDDTLVFVVDILGAYGAGA